MKIMEIMEIINVVVTFVKDGELLDVSVKSFTEVEDAEQHFRECISTFFEKKSAISYSPNDMMFDSYVEDGFYESRINGFEIRLSHSGIGCDEIINLYA